MKVTDLIELTIQRFKTRALRIFLTMFGIGIGIGIVYFLVSFGFGIQELVVGRIATSDSLLALEVSGGNEEDGIVLDKPTIDKISSISAIDEYSPLLSKEMQIQYGELVSQTTAQGVRSNYFRLAGIDEIKGNMFVDEDTNSAVVTTAVLTMFDIPLDGAIGREITISELEGAMDANSDSENKGILDSTEQISKKLKISAIIDDQNNYIFTNIENFPENSRDDVIYNSARFKVVSQDLAEPTKEAIEAMGFQVTALTDTLDQLNKVFSATQAMFAAFGIIALFISAVGMFNTMTISLLERTREIGIMKSIGATKWDIWQMFLLEAIVIGFIGGLLGIVIGVISTTLVNIALNQIASSFGGEKVDLFQTPLWFLSTIIVFSLLVGILTGLFPARRAAKINALQALRYE